MNMSLPVIQKTNGGFQGRVIQRRTRPDVPL